MTGQTSKEQRADDLVAIHEIAMDYVQGYYEGDAERMRRCLHAELAKRAVLRDPDSGAERFRHLTKERMVEITEQGGGKDEVPPDRRTYDVSVLDICDEIASVRAESAEYVDYLHVARSAGRWQIVNVLWAFKSAED
jgi:hypothetical protein